MRYTCADIGRDPTEITCSVLLRFTGDSDQLLMDRDAWAQADVDLAIVSLPKTAPPSVVDDVAIALSR